MSSFVIRPVVAGDLLAYRSARLTALKEHPEAYGSSWEEERDYDDTLFLDRMLPPAPSIILAGFSGQTLGGMGSLIVSSRLKTRHAGTIYGIYVAPPFRQASLGRALMLALLDAARQAGVLVVHLTVTVGNEAARRLYDSLGFRPYGLETRALQVDGRFFDGEHMVLNLD